MNKEVIVEIIIEELKKLGYYVNTESQSTNLAKNYKSGFFTKEKYIKSVTSLPPGKKLITEYDVRQYIKLKNNTKEFIVPENVIIGPLAEDLINSLELKIVKKKG